MSVRWNHRSTFVASVDFVFVENGAQSIAASFSQIFNPTLLLVALAGHCFRCVVG